VVTLPAGRRWLGRGLAAAGLGMIPWLGVLAVTLPASARAAHWPAAWIGLDGMEGLGLLATGLLLIRRDHRCCLTAAATSVLVLTDAWFDVTTASGGAAQAVAIAMAACVEIPVSLVCACVALRTLPRPGLPGPPRPAWDAVASYGNAVENRTRPAPDHRRPETTRGHASSPFRSPKRDEMAHTRHRVVEPGRARTTLVPHRCFSSGISATPMPQAETPPATSNLIAWICMC
jgi:hypothetical protein